MLAMTDSAPNLSSVVAVLILLYVVILTNIKQSSILLMKHIILDDPVVK